MANDSRYRILVVEDEEDISTYLRMLLEDEGYGTEAAGNGRVGYEMAQANRPDLVCLDITMPEESGIRMFRNLRGNPDLADVPVFVVTAVTGDGGNPEPFRQFLGNRSSVAAPEGFFPKPIEREVFLAAVREILPL